MKKLILLAAIGTIFTGSAKAQSAYSSNYSSASGIGVNGFRSVSEENAYMEQVMAERRKRDRVERGLNEETKQAQDRRDNRLMADNRKQQPAKMKR